MWALRIGLQPRMEFARRGGVNTEVASVAKAAVMVAAYGAAETTFCFLPLDAGLKAGSTRIRNLG